MTVRKSKVKKWMHVIETYRFEMFCWRWITRIVWDFFALLLWSPSDHKGEALYLFLSNPASCREQNPRRRHRPVWMLVSVNYAVSLPFFTRSSSETHLALCCWSFAWWTRRLKRLQHSFHWFTQCDPLDLHFLVVIYSDDQRVSPPFY